MNDQEYQRRIAANSCLYEFIETKRRRFLLHRNLTKVLNVHRADATNQIKAGSVRKKKSLRVSKSKGKHPGLDDLLDGSSNHLFDRLLKIDIKGITTKLDSNDSGRQRTEFDPKSNTSVHQSAKCRCTLSILQGLDTSLNFHFGNIAFHETRRGRIQLGKTMDGRPYAQIQLENEFLLDAASIDNIPVTKGDQTRFTLAQNYSLIIKVEPQGWVSWWPIMDNMSSMTQASMRSTAIPGHSGRVHPSIISCWGGLPMCTPEGTLLDVEVLPLGLPVTTLGMDVDVLWSAPKKLFDQEFSKTTPKVRLSSLISEPDSEQSPGTSATIQIEHEVDRRYPNEIGVTYKFSQSSDFKTSKSKAVCGYYCIFCNQRSLETRERLHFHLITFHSNFNFKLDSGDERRANGGQKILGVSVELARLHSTRKIDNDRGEIVWIAPRTPFNISEFLNGDGCWIGGKRNATPTITQQRVTMQSSRRLIPKLPPKKPAESTDDPTSLGHRKRKRTAVPPAPPSDCFHRNANCRPLKEGEVIRDSNTTVSDE